MANADRTPGGQRDMDEIYKAHASTVYKFLLAQCGSADTAEELTQETFYQAVRSIHRYDGSCKLSVWLCQIAKHLWYQQLRRQGREVPADEPWLLAGAAAQPPPPTPQQAVEARQQHLELLQRIHTLPDPTREVVYLRVFGELSFAEIAAVMGRTENWARVTFYRGKERLKKGERDDDE